MKGKDEEIKDLKEKLRQAKEDAVNEYREFEALLRELGGSFLQGFDDALRQLKKAYPDLVMMRFRVTENQSRRRMPKLPTQKSRLILLVFL